MYRCSGFPFSSEQSLKCDRCEYSQSSSLRIRTRKHLPLCGHCQPRTQNQWVRGQPFHTVERSPTNVTTVKVFKMQTKFNFQFGPVPCSMYVCINPEYKWRLENCPTFDCCGVASFVKLIKWSIKWSVCANKWSASANKRSACANMMDMCELLTTSGHQ